MPGRDRKTVYCSGALFCPEDVRAMEAIAGTLEAAGYAAFLPHADGVEAFVLNAVNKPLSNLLVFRPVVRFLNKATFALDISKIVDCDYFVFNMNGAAPDEGGVVETGIAFAIGKPIVIFRNDLRGASAYAGSTPVVGASYTCDTADDMEKIPAALEDIAGRLRSIDDTREAPTMPEPLRKVVKFGRLVGRVLRAFSLFKPRNMMSAQ